MALNKTQRDALVLLRKRVNFETADFGDAWGNLYRKQADGTFEKVRPTQYIIETTQLYRDSWVNGIIDAMLGEDAAQLRRLL